MDSNDNHNRPAILIVDDEEMVTTSLRNLFKLKTNYRTLVYSSPEQALAEAPQHPVDVVITDYLMPGMDGIAFLTQFKAVQPQAIRILLTGYADKENAIKAINTVGLYQYVEKPWDNDNLLMIVKNGVDKRALLRKLEQKIAELDETHSNLKSIQTELIKAFM